MANQSFGEKLQSFPKVALYAVLVVLTSIPLFFNLSVPNKPVEASEDFYAAVMDVPEGSTVLLETDWTGSTRGESGGEFESLIRILMRRKIKFAFYSAADPQAPQVAKDAVQRVNEERKKANEEPYKPWDDYVSLGFLPNAEAADQAIANSVVNAFPGRKAVPSSGGPAQDAFQSPVLKGKKTLKDFPLLIIITASNTSNVAIERFNGKIKMLMMVTGVMGPETQNYYTTGQVSGLVVGLKGLLDIESLMEYGLNDPQNPKTLTPTSSKLEGKAVPGFPGKLNAGKAARYYPTLHFAIFLLILAVVIGNVGMFLTKRGNAK